MSLTNANLFDSILIWFVTCALAGVSTGRVSCPYQFYSEFLQGLSWLNWDTLSGLDPLRFFSTTVAAKVRVFPFLVADVRNCKKVIIEICLTIRKTHRCNSVTHMAEFVRRCNCFSFLDRQLILISCCVIDEWMTNSKAILLSFFSVI